MFQTLARKLLPRSMRLAFAALVAALMFAATTAYAFFADPSPLGRWKTIDDETGEAKSIVKIYEVDGKLYGKVDQLLRDPNAKCTACEGEDKDAPIKDMVIMWGMNPGNGEWKGGQIFDPEKAKTYRCKIWLEDERTLKVRGYLGPFFRTQTWYRQ